MKLKVDKENDAIYFRFDDSKIVESEEIRKGIILDYNEAGKVIGIEVLNVSEHSEFINYNILQIETV
ncbi:MAG: DUF2283 domain-containing protein [Candidatus Kapabacteria bacterium]|nr:DUF2283 domain-containing protein [Candidatus Kapabacteria bacterium]